MLRAREIMSTPVVTAQPAATVKEVADLMVGHRVSGVPIVDQFGHPIGVVTESDFIAHVGATPHRGFLGRHGVNEENARSPQELRAADFMTTPVITATPDAPVRELVQLMATHGINRILIVEDGVLRGIVARADVIRTLVRTDTAIGDEIRYRLTHELWIDATHLAVQVRDDIVTLAGQVETHADAILAGRIAAATEGVFSVDTAALRYRVETVRAGDEAAQGRTHEPPDPKDSFPPFAM